MDIRINSVHFKADSDLKSFISTRLNKLSVFHDDIQRADVFLKLSNNQETDNKITEIKLNIPGNDFFAKKQSKSFEESTDNAVEALRRQIKKKKEKVKGI